MLKKNFFIKYCLLLVLILAQNVTAEPDTLSAKTDSSFVQPDSLATKKKSESLKDTVDYEAEFMEYDAESKVLHLQGKAVVRYQNLTLAADTIAYQISENLFLAKGLPQLIEGNDTTIGESMAYNIKTRRGRVTYASTHLDDAYFRGTQIVTSKKNELYVHQGDYSTCAKIDEPHYFFYGREIKILPNDKIISRPVVLNIGDAPVAVLPYFIFPTEKSRRSGFLTPSWGGHPNGGGYVDNIGYFFVPNDYLDMTVQARAQEFKDYVLNFSSNYVLRYLLNGSFSARYAEGTGFGEGRRQWALDYSHNQSLTPDGLTRLAGSGSMVSTKNFYRRFSEDTTELIDQNISANMSLSRSFESINGSGSITWNRQHNLSTDHVTQDLPSINFSLPSRPLIPFKSSDQSSFGQSETSDTEKDEPNWYNNIYWGYNARANIRHDYYTDSTIAKFVRPGANHNVTLSAPQKLFKHITISPYFNASQSIFNGSIDTAVIDSVIVYDTIVETLRDTLDRGRFPSYRVLGIKPDVKDSLGIPITNYLVTKEGNRRIQPIHNENEGYADNQAWDAGVSMSTTLYGLFPIKLFNFTGLRHTFTPSMGFSYLPEVELDKTFYDVGIGYTRGRPTQKLVNFSVGNQFQGKMLKKVEGQKEAKEEKFQILSLNANTSYDFEADSLNWRNLGVSASTSLRSLNVTMNAQYWLYDEYAELSLPILRDYSISLSMGSLGARGKLWGGDLLELDSLIPDDPIEYANAGAQSWNFSFTPSYSYSMSRQTQNDIFKPRKNYNLSASAALNFTRNWSIRWGGNYNFVENQIVQNSFSIGADLECWDMNFEWRPERLNPGYNFRINIKKMPEIKWEDRG